MIEIDGSDGGGQLVRTALSLAAITGEPIRMENVRGARSNPGLRQQHLAVLNILTDVCDAAVSEVAVGSDEFEFRPGSITPGTYGIDIGTAGSVPLLFDALFPLAVATDEPLSVSGRGGTDVRWSPPIAYQSRVKLPVLREHGLHAVVERDRPGFYPAGGGVSTLRLAPSSLTPIALTDRGPFQGARVYSLASEALAGDEVAQRQAETAVERLEEHGLGTVECAIKYAETDSPGSSVVIRLDFARAIAGADALGERGKPAEVVANEAVEDAILVRDSRAAVDRYMADQLVLPLALAGGRVSIPDVTEHVATSVDLLGTFDLAVRVEQGDTPKLVSSGTDAIPSPD
ncbi:RNA 3'-terminal phosphate cyclase [Halocatena pleomorpha]|uniref:RNA 3'-terminal phosphate cyclase n=1 Tax=Halocatena pleomorpha TaxID=1785090 RepID=A0A3P3R7G8_9EURY|nr:RNA 3'-terminal phosphate cyclase [Halocatena pleomorpha]RRJ29402.1 RNA 3'-terminal phosphate cyclase [Halocatena pleomorpha]